MTQHSQSDCADALNSFLGETEPDYKVTNRWLSEKPTKKGPMVPFLSLESSLNTTLA